MRGPLADLSFEAAGSVDGGARRGRDRERQRRGDERRRSPRGLRMKAAGLVIDLSQVTYLDSVGIELLFDLARRLRTHRQQAATRGARGCPDASRPRAVRHRSGCPDRCNRRGRAPRLRGAPRLGSPGPMRPGLVLWREVAGQGVPAADQEARKRSSVSFSRPGGSPLEETRISPTRFANACNSSNSPRPVSLLGRVVRQMTPTSLPDGIIGA